MGMLSRSPILVRGPSLTMATCHGPRQCHQFLYETLSRLTDGATGLSQCAKMSNARLAF